MLFKNIRMINPVFQALDDMTVGVKDGYISYIGSYEGLPDKGSWGEVYDGRGKLLIPGLYNIHCHTPMTMLRGYGENMSLQDWLTLKIFPFEAKMTPDDLYFAYLLGVAEMVRFGTVANTDMYFMGDSMARAILDSGFKSNMSVSVTCFNSEPYEKHPMYRENLALLEKYHLSGEGRIKLDLSLHAEYTSTPLVAAGLAAHCKSLGLHMHVHVSETRREHEECKSRHDGKTPARFLYEQGIFDSPATAAHCVWVEDGDLEIMADKGVTLASCPVSNLKLASGFFPAHKAVAKGINIGLGTDSVASNNNLNLFEEIKLYATLHKAVTGDPAIVTPEEAFACATINGARSQGRLDCGSIDVGNKADLVVIDREAPNLHPCYNELYNLVYAATGSEVVLTMIDGQILYRDGTWPTLDISEVTNRVNTSCHRILKELVHCDI